ncbi:hypothetical protein A2U01_0059648, partial [Trifolium medium]|nr:hypothetical protein [Trifolium medium]
IANSSEYQIDNALAVKMIMEGIDFDLGNTLCTSLYNKANNKETPLTLGHCNLISALCKDKGVPDYPGDERLYSIKALPVSQFTGYSKRTAPVTPRFF